MKRIAIALLPLCLSACFSADEDLIGSHAVMPVRLDSLVTLNGYPYRVDTRPEGIVACEIRLKTDDDRSCWERYRLRFERTRGGNLIVQATGIDAKFLENGSSVFLLATRTGGAGDDCFFLLGETSEEGPPEMTRAEHAIAEEYGNEPIDRAKLLAIVDAYERTVLPLAGRCAGQRVVVPNDTGLTFADEPQPESPAP